MYGVVVIKETGKVHGVVPDLIRIMPDSVFGENESLEGINMEVCSIHAFATEVEVGDKLPEGLTDYSNQFIFVPDTEILGQQMTEREIEAIVQGQQITDMDIRLMMMEMGVK